MNEHILKIIEDLAEVKTLVKNHLKHHERIEDRLLYPMAVSVGGLILLRILQILKVVPNF